MLDIRLIREKPDFVRARLATRAGDDEAKIDGVLRADAGRRKLETALQQLNADRNRLSKEIGKKLAGGEGADELQGRVRDIGDQIADLNARAASAEAEQNNLLLQLQTCRMRAFQLAKIRAQIASSAAGARNRHLPTRSITWRLAQDSIFSIRSGRQSSAEAVLFVSQALARSWSAL